MKGMIRVLGLAGGLVVWTSLSAASPTALPAALPQSPRAGAAPALKAHLVVEAREFFTFAGKQITVPVGAEYKLENGSLVIKLTESAEKDVSVVRIGETYVAISKDEPLVIDPRGRPSPRRRYVFALPGLKYLSVQSISDAPDASPVHP